MRLLNAYFSSVALSWGGLSCALLRALQKLVEILTDPKEVTKIFVVCNHWVHTCFISERTTRSTDVYTEPDCTESESRWASALPRRLDRACGHYRFRLDARRTSACAQLSSSFIVHCSVWLIAVFNVAHARCQFVFSNATLLCCGTDGAVSHPRSTAYFRSAMILKLTALTIKNRPTVFWEVTPCRLILLFPAFFLVVASLAHSSTIKVRFSAFLRNIFKFQTN